MRGSNERQDHHPPRLVGAGRRLATALVLVIGAGAPMLAGRVEAAGGVTIRLPTRADLAGTNPLEGAILGNPVPTKLPGTVADEETVRVDAAPDGTPRSVDVVQRLTLSGTGDFTFRLGGPATQVKVLPESQGVPALRRGSVIWQGFSTGRKVLSAELSLDPAIEASRLPVRMTLGARVDGRPVREGSTPSGSTVLTITLENVTAAPVQVPDAGGDARALAQALDRIAAVVRSGRSPQPGADGIPKNLTVSNQPTHSTEQIGVPVTVRGSMVLPEAAFQGVQVVWGGQLERTPSGFRIAYAATLGGAAPNRLTIRVTGRTSGFAWPTATLTAVPAVGPSEELAPPGGGTWSSLVASGGVGADPHTMLRLIMRTMWQAARYGQYAAYIGNPDATGPSSSTYMYRVGPAARGGVALVSVRRVSLTGVVAVSAIALFVLFGLALVWARS